MSEEEIIDELMGDDVPNDVTNRRDELLKELDDCKQEYDDIQTSVVKIQSSKLSPVNNDEVFNEMSDLTNRATSILDVCKNAISSTSLVDSDLIEAYASMIKATREVISEYIEIYKIRQQHLDRIELENIKHKNRKELVLYKKDIENMVDDTKAGVDYIQEDVIDVINRKEKGEI